MSVKITCDSEKNVVFGNGAHVAMLERTLSLKEENEMRREEEKEESRGLKAWSDHGGRDHILTISDSTDRRTL